MIMVQPPTATRIRTTHGGNHLGHHLGGLADDYYYPDGESYLQVPNGSPRCHKSTQTTSKTRKITDTEAEVVALLARLRALDRSASRSRPGPAIFPLDKLSFEKSLAVLEVALSSKSPPVSRPTPVEERCATDDLEDDVPMAQPAEERMAFSDNEFDGEDSEAEIRMARPAIYRMELSDDESDSEDDIPMARPALQRRGMSDCFSVGSSDDVESFTDDISMAKPSSPVRVDRAFIPLEKGHAHDVAFHQGASHRSYAARIYSEADSEDSDEDVEILRPGVYNYPAREPSPIVDLTQVAFLEELHRYPFFDETREQVNFAEVDEAPALLEDPVWLEDNTALLAAGPGEFCMARFVTTWEDPYAQPIDQSLFADFGGDFTNSPEVGVVEGRRNSWAAGDDG